VKNPETLNPKILAHVSQNNGDVSPIPHMGAESIRQPSSAGRSAGFTPTIAGDLFGMRGSKEESLRGPKAAGGTVVGGYEAPWDFGSAGISTKVMSHNVATHGQGDFGELCSSECLGGGGTWGDEACRAVST